MNLLSALGYNKNVIEPIPSQLDKMDNVAAHIEERIKALEETHHKLPKYKRERVIEYIHYHESQQLLRQPQLDLTMQEALKPIQEGVQGSLKPELKQAKVETECTNDRGLSI